MCIMCRDHSFPRNAEFSAEPQNLPTAMELLLFAEFGTGCDKGTNTVYFGRVQATLEN